MKLTKPANSKLQIRLQRVELQQGIYELVINKALSEALNEIDSKGLQFQDRQIYFDESTDMISNYMQRVLKIGLTKIGNDAKKRQKGSDSDKEKTAIEAEINACNRLIEVLSSIARDEEIGEWKIGESGKKLLSIWKEINKNQIRPRSSLSISSLFTGGNHSIVLSEELCREIQTADEIDFLVSFIKFSGLRLIYDSLQKFTLNGGILRVICTTYMGATEPIAIEKLSALPNTEIRISYNTKSTRLHAKSYIFKRKTGFDTVYIGSSNLSKAATNDGMEWNVKLTNQDAPQIISTVHATFESYWNSPDFELYDTSCHEKLVEAINHENKPPRTTILPFDWNPFPFQKQILDELYAEREVFGSYRNLVIAATGTGKTVIAAFDYKRFLEDNPGSINRLLFVAHRKEILEKSRLTFQSILNDSNFGELIVGGRRPVHYDHLFMSIDTLESMNLETLVDCNHFDYIVVDETHHGAAKSYNTLLTYFKPKILLGLTATPERMDGKDILQYFNNRIASEIRLPEAINRELLVPFHYFMVTDRVDLSNVKFTRGKYDLNELRTLYENNSDRVDEIVSAVNRYQPDVDSIKGLGFCVSKQHAEYMAEQFTKFEIPSIALTSDSNEDERRQAPNRLRKGAIKFIFTVDLYNEGVDIKEINTVLFLRPTESMTVFIQQLGRGLRTCSGKTELTVLDFVGQANKKYQVHEQKLRYLTSATAIPISKQINDGFCGLPNGCNIKLEEKAKEYILDNIKLHAKSGYLEDRFKDYMDVCSDDPKLTDFLEFSDLELSDIYKSKTKTFTGIYKRLNKKIVPDETEEKLFSKAFVKLSTIDSKSWIEKIKTIIKGSNFSIDETDRLFVNMLYYTFYNEPVDRTGYASIEDFLHYIRTKKEYCNELLDILDIRLSQIKFVEIIPELEYPCALRIHCSYYRDQILAGLGINSSKYKQESREGTLYLNEKKTDVFFINLNKNEKDFSPTTMYDDYAINEKLFHWQSQSTTSSQSKTGQRYIHHDEIGSDVLLFVRIHKEVSGKAMPYMFLGKGHYISHDGNKPMSIVWKMEEPMPSSITAYSPIGN